MRFAFMAPKVKQNFTTIFHQRNIHTNTLEMTIRRLYVKIENEKKKTGRACAFNMK